MKLRLLFIVLVLVVVTPTADAAVSFTPDVQHGVPGLLRRYAVPTADVALVQGSTVVWSRAFGSNVATDLFEVASLTKTATALAVLRLVEEHKIALDEPVNTYLHRWKMTSTRFDVSKVTVRRLLDHTAGLPFFSAESPLSSYPGIVRILEGKASYPRATPVIRPGTRFVYSNLGYGVLELLIEEVTHESYPDAMKALVLDPLFMLSSGFQDDLSLETQVLPGFKRTGHPVGPFLHYPRAAGGMLSTEHDIGRLLVGAMVPKAIGGLLEPKTLHEMHRLEPATRDAFALGHDGGYALGIATGRFTSGRSFVGNNGSVDGFNTLMVGVPSKQVGLVVLTNSSTGLGVELDVAGMWLRDQANDGLGLLNELALVRTILRLLAVALLLLALFEVDRLYRQVRNGERRWSESFHALEIAKGVGLVVSAVALLVVFDTGALTGAFGSLAPARFVSGEFEPVTVMIAVACLASGVALAITARTMES